MKYYIKALKNYAVFKGRARRKEFWMYVLFTIIFTLIALFLDNRLGLTFSKPYTAHLTILGLTYRPIEYGPIYTVYSLITLLPSLSITARRLHDIGKSGWFMLLTIIPVAGAIWLLVLLCIDGDQGMNEYGVNPKEIDNATVAVL